jgi:hypothetical protein
VGKASGCRPQPPRGGVGALPQRKASSPLPGGGLTRESCAWSVPDCHRVVGGGAPPMCITSGRLSCRRLRASLAPAQAPMARSAVHQRDDRWRLRSKRALKTCPRRIYSGARRSRMGGCRSGQLQKGVQICAPFELDLENSPTQTISDICDVAHTPHLNVRV